MLWSQTVLGTQTRCFKAALYVFQIACRLDIQQWSSPVPYMHLNLTWRTWKYCTTTCLTSSNLRHLMFPHIKHNSEDTDQWIPPLYPSVNFSTFFRFPCFLCEKSAPMKNKVSSSLAWIQTLQKFWSNYVQFIKNFLMFTYFLPVGPDFLSNYLSNIYIYLTYFSLWLIHKLFCLVACC